MKQDIEKLEKGKGQKVQRRAKHSFKDSRIWAIDVEKLKKCWLTTLQLRRRRLQGAEET